MTVRVRRALFRQINFISMTTRIIRMRPRLQITTTGPPTISSFLRTINILNIFRYYSGYQRLLHQCIRRRIQMTTRRAQVSHRHIRPQLGARKFTRRRHSITIHTITRRTMSLAFTTNNFSTRRNHFQRLISRPRAHYQA